MDAKDRALRYLNQRMCSAHQMRDYLRRKGHEDDEIDPLIEELSEYGYLDDRRYAIAFIESGYEKGRGIARIRRELRQKGVDPEVIAFAEGEVEETPDEFSMALVIGEKIVETVDMEGMDYQDKEKLKAKVARRLAGRGFSPDVIYRVANRLVR